MIETDPKTPGQLLRDLLRERGWTQEVLAIVLGVSKSSISMVLAGTRPVTAEFALGLEEVFDVPAERFLELQKRSDLARAQLEARPDPGRRMRARLYGDLPIAEMRRRGWLALDDVRDVRATEAALMRFFDARSVEEIEVLPHAAKKTQVTGPVSPAQLAWIYRVRSIASEMLVRRYSDGMVRGAIDKLAALRSDPELARHVPRIMAEAGIRFVIVESLPSAKIDGVCFWINESSPVVGMSLRFDRIDNFWFVLRHELEHVARGHGRDAIMLDAELEGERAGVGDSVSEEERLANEAAADFCVPRIAFERFVARKSPFFAERDVLGFARTLNVHPGLVAGQIQRITGRYERFRNHLVKIRACVAPGAMVDGWGDVAPVDG